MSEASLYCVHCDAGYTERLLLAPVDLVSTLGPSGPSVPPALVGTTIVARAVAALGQGPVDWAVYVARQCTQHLRDADDKAAKIPADLLRRGAEAAALDILLELSGAASAYELCRPFHQEVVRHIANLDVPMRIAVSALRFEQHFFTSQLLDRAAVQGGSPAFISGLTLALSRCFDRFIDLQVADYAAAREQLARAGGAVRQQIISTLLKGHHVDPDLVSDRLGVDLDDTHLACVVRPKPFAEYEAATRTASSLAQLFGSPPRLRVDQSNGDLWLWFALGKRDRSASGRLSSMRHKGVIVGVGSGQAGAGGFRRSLVEALDALRVAETSRVRETAVFNDIALAALMSNDLERCRWFVENALGSLAGPSREMRELRDTLSHYYSSGHRLVTAARRLHVHRNTLMHRLERLAVLLGHPVHEHTAEVQAALLLRDLLGDAVGTSAESANGHQASRS